MVLGRDVDDAQVSCWLEVAAYMLGFVSFAVGHSTFETALRNWLVRTLSEDEAMAETAQFYLHWVRVYQAAKR